LWQRWPTVLAIAFFLLNVDVVLMPSAVSLGLPCGWPLFLFAAFCATAEPTYWNWYAKWVVLNVKQSERVQRVKTAFRRDDLGAQIREFLEEKFDWFVEHARLHADGGEANRELRENAAALIKGTHILVTYPMMLFFGFLPSGWPFAIFIQRIFPVPGGFVVFLTANALKTYFIGLVYLWMPWWGKLLFVTGAITFLTFGTRKVIRQVNVFKVP
jgi:hypothetical protein